MSECSAALTGSAGAQQKQQSRSLWATALNKTEKTWNPHAEKRNKALILCPNPNTEAEPCQIICRMNAKNLHSPNSKMYNVIQELQKIWITGQMELQRLSFLPHFSGEEFCNKKIGFLWIFSVIYHILGPYILPKFSFNKEMENEKKTHSCFWS